MPDPLIIARHGDVELGLLPALANRHGLVTGATGTGKTVTLQVMAERFSSIGVPVFMADVKGDLAGISQPGATSPKFAERLKLVGVGGRGHGAWLVAEPGEVDGAGGVEGFLGGAGGEAGAQDRILVAVVGCGVDREAERMGRAAVAQAA